MVPGSQKLPDLALFQTHPPAWAERLECSITLSPFWPPPLRSDPEGGPQGVIFGGRGYVRTFLEAPSPQNPGQALEPTSLSDLYWGGGTY